MGGTESPMAGRYKQRLGFPIMGLSITLEIGGYLLLGLGRRGYKK